MLKAAYSGLTIVMTLFVIYIGIQTIRKTYSDPKVIKSNTLKLVIGLLGWQLFIYLISISGWTQTFELPPRFALFFIIPSFIFTGVFFYKKKDAKWISNIHPQVAVYTQSFRIIVETIFVFSVAENILHPNVTIEGYNYDMVFAFTAPIIGYLVFNAKVLSTKVAIIWNYLGIGVLASVIFVFISSIYLPEIYGETDNLLPMEATMYPYVLVAGFLMPLAVFIHVFSIVQLKRLKN